MVYNWINTIQLALANHCLLCGADASANARVGLCSGCQNALPRNRCFCPRCALPLAHDTFASCGRCQQSPPAFDRILAPLRYEYPVAEMILQLKHRHRLAVGRVFGRLLAEAVVASAIERPDTLLAVPLHRARLRERGFNQAMELARMVGKELALPVLRDPLVRVTATSSQATLKREQRLRNLTGAFAFTGAKPPRNVAVIDDVVTTGATAEAIAKVLKNAGVERIQVWAVARTPWHQR